MSGTGLVSCGSGTRLETPSDAELLQSLGAREPAALERLYDRHAPYALGIASRILGDREEAEALVQDVFGRLWKRQVRYDPRRGCFSTWLFATSRDRALDRLRQRARRPEDHPIGAVHYLPAFTGADVAPDPRRCTVDTALAQLPDPERRAIQLSFYQGMTHSEIARTVGEPPETVKRRIARAVARMRTNLASSGVTA